MASALHLRGVPLKRITSELWANLTEFEKKVCQAYRAFCVGWKTKRGAARPTIPSALALSFLPCVKNLIENPKQLCDSSLCPMLYLTAPLPPKPEALSDVITLNSRYKVSQKLNR